MRGRFRFLGFLILFFGLISTAIAQDFNLQYFLTRVSSKAEVLSKKERLELLHRIEEVFQRAEQIHLKILQTLQTGEVELRYQEGKFWMSKLEEDQVSIQNGKEQIKWLGKNPDHLVASIKLYKSLKDLSSNFNSYNNLTSFSAFVGDLAPEMELWADPIFYQLYLLPLAHLKNLEKPSLQKEKKPVPKGKKP